MVTDFDNLFQKLIVVGVKVCGGVAEISRPLPNSIVTNAAYDGFIPITP